MKTLFHKQKRLLEHFYAHLDLEKCHKIFEKVLACRGVVFFTGVGKSGFIAQKVAATMLSTGTKAFYLSPVDALHGDLGGISSEDLVLMFSKSGESEELIQLLPFLRHKKVTVIALTSSLLSSLEKGADCALELPCLQELCPFDLSPSISTEVQLLFGDVLTIAVMQAKKFSVDAYAANHPAGKIGRRASVRVRDLMLDKERIPLCHPHHRLEDVLKDFSSKRCGCMIVVDHNKCLKGIFTDGDLRRALQQKGDKVLQESISLLMTANPKTIKENALAWEAVKLMERDQKKPVMVLPVLEENQGKVVGIIKMHDIIQSGI